MPDAGTNTLRSTFEAAKISKVAIVDDAYDPPTKIDLDEGDWSGFTEACEDHPTAFGHIFPGKAGGDGGEMPSFGDLRNEDVARLWNDFISRISLDVSEDGVSAATNRLFGRFYDVRKSKLDELKAVFDIATEACGGAAPITLPSTVAPRELVAFDLVFLDFFLGDESIGGEPNAELRSNARHNAISAIKGAMGASSTSPCPLFVLISSRASNEDIPLFRDEAELLASKFRFVAKPVFRSERTRAEFILGTLASQRKAADAAELLLDRWTEQVREALLQMQRSARRLDVSDYAYIQNYRLDDEKIPLLGYLTWMFNAYLGSLVEARMATTEASSVASLKEVSTIPPVLRPMSELPRIYSDIITTKVRPVDHQGEPIKVWTGDLFVRSSLVPTALNEAGRADGCDAGRTSDGEPRQEAANSQDHAAGDGLPSARPQRINPEKPDVLAVITPVCDLVPGRVKVKSVVLAGGSIREFGHLPKPSNHLIVLDRPGSAQGVQARPHQIDWHPGWPQTFELGAFTGDAIIGTDYVKVLRLREMYAAELAGALSGSLGRIGVPIAPPFSHPLSLRLLYKPRVKGEAAVLDLGIDEPLAWEFYSARNEKTRRCGIDSELIWTINDKAKALGLDGGHPALSILTDPEAWRPLTVPFDAGSGKVVSPGRKGLCVQRLAEKPEAPSIQAAEAHVLVQLIGPLPPASDHDQKAQTPGRKPAQAGAQVGNAGPVPALKP